MTQSYRDTGHPCIHVRGSCMSVQDPAFRASQPVGFSGQLGKEQTRANAEDLFSRHGVGFGQPDSTPHPGTCSVGAELPQDFIRQDVGPTETLSEAPGAYGCSCGEVPPGLLHMRPLQHWLHCRVPRWAWKRGTHRVQITPACRKTFSPWSDPSFLQAGVPLEQVSRHAVVFTDASATGWGGHVQRARSVRDLDGSPTALAYQLPRAAGSTPGLEPPQRAPSRQGRSGPYGQHCKPLRISTGKAVYAPVACRNSPATSSSGVRSIWGPFVPSTSQECSTRRPTSCLEQHFLGSGDSIPRRSSWLELVRSCSGRPGCISRNHPLPVVLHLNRGNARHRCTGTQLAPGPAQVCVFPSEPTSTDTVQDQGGRGAGLVSGSILAQQDLVPGTHAPRDSPSLADSSEEGSAFSETGHPLAPASRLVETPCVVPGQDAEVLGDLPQEVALTIASARAPSTRRAYALKWNLFVEWCSSHREDPRRCSIRAVLSFLQQGLERRLSPSTLKVYVAAISAHHDPIEGRSVGKHNLVVRFLRGARRLNPPRPPSLPSWDLALVLRALQTAPFEPLQSVELKFLSMKTLLLTALASIKRVGDLQAFSVDESCLEFGLADSSTTLRPRPGYVPKVPTTPFRDQVVNLQALPLEEADPALALLCPVRALRQYVDRTQSFRTSEQLFVCYGGQQKGNAVSKQRMAHWTVDAITLAYEAQGVPCPLRLRAHSTRGVASSWALARGASLADICRAAGWATPNTFARFYSLRVELVSSCVLTSNG